MTAAAATRLSAITAMRLRNQLGRVSRQTFGAEQGLQELVKLATMQMLASGESRRAIREALTRMVEESAGESRAVTLRAEVLRWSDGTVPARSR